MKTYMFFLLFTIGGYNLYSQDDDDENVDRQRELKTIEAYLSKIRGVKVDDSEKIVVFTITKNKSSYEINMKNISYENFRFSQDSFVMHASKHIRENISNLRDRYKIYCGEIPSKPVGGKDEVRCAETILECLNENTPHIINSVKIIYIPHFN